MTIVPVEKVTLYGLLAEKPAMLEALQEIGCVHLVSLRPGRTAREQSAPARAEHVTQALRYLLGVRERRRQVRGEDGFDLEAVVARVLENRARRRVLEDERDFLIERIGHLEPWGDFRFPPREALAQQRLWFYRMPLRMLRRLRDVELPWQVVHRDNQEAYVVVLSVGLPPPSAMPVPRIRIGAVSLSELKARLERVEVEIEDLEAERQSLTRWIEPITRNLTAAEDRAALARACGATRDEEPLFAVQAWVAHRDRARLEAFARARRLALLSEPPGPGERPPTLLDNPPAVGGGQDLVGFYQTPGYRSWDPSVVVFFSFAAFFAMILADAGYALLLGAVLLWFWRRLGRSPAARRARSLAAAVLTASVLYGVIAGSYFGMVPSEGGALARLWLLDLGDFETMMRVTVVIGCVHIALAAAIRAAAERSLAGALPHVGWIAVIAGGLLAWLGGEAARAAGLAVIGASLCVIVAFSGTRPVRRPVDLALRLAGGLPALMNVSALFGDVLSYLRLFALGLASSSLAVTFNEMAHGVRAAVPGVGLLFALVILLLGHAINLALALVSGFVHGLRLNFIEFFRWGISEEGYPFRAFAKKEFQH